ncbi:hypothetical protein BT69DRAFT_1350163 [Atractiella rhizophila]|nr:hypothetical protein BT69DRAFT_1350163 [Atractiella rhizophila]
MLNLLSTARPSTPSQSLTSSQASVAFSPASSTSASNWSIAVQEKVLNEDPKYRKFSTAVEKTLLSFESVNEWADFITFLAKLLKTLQQSPPFTLIPHRLVVSKRLSQCLNPALPTGVHQRALEVYTVIFERIGTENLKRDLAVWSSGIFPFFASASTSVRPLVLQLLNRFYLPLPAPALRPITRSLLLSLLPGLEEESSDSFEGVFSLLSSLQSALEPQSFLIQTLWIILKSSPSLRTSVLNFLLKKFPAGSVGLGEDVQPLVGEDLGLMIRAMAAALTDENLLVLRGALDLCCNLLPLNGKGFEQAREGDRVLVVDAALGIVLRRDLSLSRRLYTWLLGKDDATEKQLGFFNEHGVKYVATALFNQIRERKQRPFKIFISLLDKWEIGATLTEYGIVGMLQALKEASEGGEAHDEVIMSANMLIDSLDPGIVWRCLWKSILEEGKHQENQESTVSLLLFVLRTFILHDDESLTLHIPRLAFALLDLHSPPSPRRLELIRLMLEITPAPYFAQGNVESVRRIPTEEGTALKAMERVLDVSGDGGGEGEGKGEEGRELLSAGLGRALRLKVGGMGGETFRLIRELTRRVGHDELAVRAPDGGWGTWIQGVFGDAAEGEGEGEVETVQTILEIAASGIRPRLKLESRRTVEKLIDKLLDYLSPEHAKDHVKVTEMLWALDSLSKRSYVETKVAERLATKDPSAYEGFGILWRSTPDEMLPGKVLKTPMFVMLDCLRSDNMSLRRLGEAWLRCSLKSYIRVLDPILLVLLDPSIQREMRTHQMRGKEVGVWTYEKVFDQARTKFTLEILLHLVRFGGQGFTRLANATKVDGSFDAEVKGRCAMVGLGEMSYLAALVELLVRLLRSEPADHLAESMSKLNSAIHATVADLLQTLVSRGELDLDTLLLIQRALTSRLLICLDRQELDLQNKYLHVLHPVIHAVGVHSRRQESKNQAMVAESSGSNDAHINTAISPVAQDPLLVQVLMDGLSTQKDIAILHHWVDFFLMTIGEFRKSLQIMFLPLLDCLVLHLRGFILRLEKTNDPMSKGKQIENPASELEYVVLTNALERVLLLSFEEVKHILGAEEDGKGLEKSSTETGLFGYMSNVLGTSDSSGALAAEEPSNVKEAASQRFAQAIELFFYSWQVSSALEESSPSPSASGDLQQTVASKIKQRTRKVAERLYKVMPGDVLECAIEYSLLGEEKTSPAKEKAVFSLIDHLTPSAQAMVGMLFDKLSLRLGMNTEKKIPPTLFTPQDAPTLFVFLERYLETLEGPIAVQVWNQCMVFCRSVLNLGAVVGRPWSFPCLRCFTTLAERVARTSALEDRRIRRELQDVFVRLVDAVILIGGKALESTGWKSRMPNGVDDEEKEKEKDDTSPLDGSPGYTIIDFLAVRVVANFKRFLIENDKINGLCANVIYYVVAPAFKSKSKSFVVDDSILDLLIELTQVPSALKSWRPLVSELFADNRFFNSPPSSDTKWKPIIQSFLASDKERFNELVSKISTAASANIFTNREHEALLRAISIRRMSYAIFTGDKNGYLNQLPKIQEKLVDLLRSPVGEIVHAEVYLCLRVVLCRISNQHLSTFWPVILTELLRLFESLLDSIQCTPDQLSLVLSACKFLDLVLVLQTEEFQIHQWMFLTDTVDAVYPPSLWTPTAILDRLGEILHRNLSSTHTPHPNIDLNNGLSPSTGLRRPLLARFKANTRLEGLEDLEPFFYRLSVSAYEGVYAEKGVDWKEVEESVEVDIFEGAE